MVPEPRPARRAALHDRSNRAAFARRGQTVRIRLALGDLSEAVMVARGGFYQTTGGQWAYVVDESGEFATKRTIRLGRQNTLVFEVLEGLEAGEKVITSSYDHFDYNRIDKLVFN